MLMMSGVECFNVVIMSTIYVVFLGDFTMIAIITIFKCSINNHFKISLPFQNILRFSSISSSVLKIPSL